MKLVVAALAATLLTLSSAMADEPIRALSVEDVVARHVAGDWVPEGAVPDTAGMVPLLQLRAGADYTIFAARPARYASRRAEGGGAWKAHEAIDGTLEIGLVGYERGFWRVYRLMKNGSLQQTDEALVWRRLTATLPAGADRPPSAAMTLDEVAAEALTGMWISVSASDGSQEYLSLLSDRTYVTETSGGPDAGRIQSGDGGWFAHAATDGALELGFWAQPDGEDTWMILRAMSDGTLRQVDNGATWSRN